VERSQAATDELVLVMQGKVDAVRCFEPKVLTANLKLAGGRMGSIGEELLGRGVPLCPVVKEPKGPLIG
jgi:hypothetical protein